MGISHWIVFIQFSTSLSRLVLSAMMKLGSVFILFSLVVNVCQAGVVSTSTNQDLTSPGTEDDLTDQARLFFRGTCRCDAHKIKEVATCVVDALQPSPDKFTYLGWDNCHNGYVPVCGKIFNHCSCLCKPAPTMKGDSTTNKLTTSTSGNKNFQGDNEMEKREEEMKKIEKDMKKREEDMKKKEEEMKKREEDMKKREDEMKKREDSIVQQEDVVAQREEEVVQREEYIAKREDNIAKREDDIAKREDDIAMRGEDVARREEDVAKRE